MSFLKNNFFSKKVTVAVHNGKFHPDDVFVVAILSLYLKKPLQIFRTRDQKIWSGCDYVCDVGGEYDPAKNHFDHHQVGYDEKRNNGIVYSSAGLIWKEFGEKICGSAEVAQKIDEKIIQPIDANDNGIDLTKNNFEGISPYNFGDYIYALNPLPSEGYKKSMQKFRIAVAEAKKVLEREIQKATEKIAQKKVVETIYKNTEDKKIIVLDDNYSWTSVLAEYPEPLFVITPDFENTTWHVNAVKKNDTAFESKLSFPESWAGLRDEDLQKISTVPDAIFCHKARFIAVAKSKEGAIKLAQLAIAEVEPR